MSFATFQQLPNRLGAMPEIYRAIPIEKPPVYDTGALVKPILNLADYLSPESRAKRKAAVARANYEYKMYSSGVSAKDPFYYYKVQDYKNRQRAAYDSHLRTQAYLKSKGVNVYETPAQKAFRARTGKTTTPPSVSLEEGEEERDLNEADNPGLQNVSLDVAYEDEEE